MNAFHQRNKWEHISLVIKLILSRNYKIQPRNNEIHTQKESGKKDDYGHGMRLTVQYSSVLSHCVNTLPINIFKCAEQKIEFLHITLEWTDNNT